MVSRLALAHDFNAISSTIATLIPTQFCPMEPRKRPLPDEDDYVVTKKRILTGANGGPHVNGMALEDEGEAFGDKLEVSNFALYTFSDR